MNPSRITVNQDPAYRRRRWNVGLAAAGVLLAAGTQLPHAVHILEGGAAAAGQDVSHVAGGTVARLNETISGPELSQDQLAALPQQPEKIATGFGADAAIAEADGRNVPMSLKADLEEYVERQGLGPNHILQAGQQVMVPKLPEQYRH